MTDPIWKTLHQFLLLMTISCPRFDPADPCPGMSHDRPTRGQFLGLESLQHFVHRSREVSCSDSGLEISFSSSKPYPNYIEISRGGPWNESAMTHLTQLSFN